MNKFDYLFECYDQDKDGFWTKDNFISFLYELGKQENVKDQFDACFDFINVSKTGKIDLNEFKQRLPELYSVKLLPETVKNNPAIEPKSSPHYHLYSTIQITYNPSEDLSDQDNTSSTSLPRPNKHVETAPVVDTTPPVRAEIKETPTNLEEQQKTSVTDVKVDEKKLENDQLTVEKKESISEVKVDEKKDSATEVNVEKKDSATEVKVEKKDSVTEVKVDANKVEAHNNSTNEQGAEEDESEEPEESGQQSNDASAGKPSLAKPGIKAQLGAATRPIGGAAAGLTRSVSTRRPGAAPVGLQRNVSTRRATPNAATPAAATGSAAPAYVASKVTTASATPRITSMGKDGEVKTAAAASIAPKPQIAQKPPISATSATGPAKK